MKYILLTIGILLGLNLPANLSRHTGEIGIAIKTPAVIPAIQFTSKSLDTLEPAPVVTASVTEAPSGAHEEWMKAAGIPASNWPTVETLIHHESSWNVNAINPSSGACGLVQALPCSKIPGDWKNPVDALRWGHSYVLSKYGSWAKAWSSWQSRSPHWY